MAGAGYPMVGSHDPAMIALAHELAAQHSPRPRTPGRCRCSTASAPTSSAGWPPRAPACAPTCPTASTGTPTSCAGSPSARPTSRFFLRSLLSDVLNEVPDMDAVTQVPAPRNEPVLTYAPGSAERAALQARLNELADEPVELTSTIGGRQRMSARCPTFDVVAAAPARRRPRHLGARHARRRAGRRPLGRRRPPPAGRSLSFDDRAAVFLKAADLLAGPWRQTLNAATMLGPEQDRLPRPRSTAACELIDFWRFNVHFARQILAEQPESPAPASGTASTTARSRASSTPSRRSTSPRSPATCRPRRR